MVEWSRRELLVALAGVTALAGCGGAKPSPTASPSQSEQPTESPSPTPSESSTPTPTPDPIESSGLSFAGSVVRQPSEEDPGRIRASLTNHSDRTIDVIGGAPVPLSPGIDDGPDDALLLLPDESDRINEYSWTRDGDPKGGARIDDAIYEDCWRAPGDGYLSTDLGATSELSASETVDADFYPLAAADADCPRGRYTAQDELSTEQTDQSIHTELTVDIDADGRLEVDASISVDDP